MNKGRKERSAGISLDAKAKKGKDKSAEDRDPMIAARDYVEDGRLEEAVYVLERAVLAQPQRLDLQDELLSLYQSAYNEKGFERFYNVLIRKRMVLSEEWSHLKNFFKGLSDERNL